MIITGNEAGEDYLGREGIAQNVEIRFTTPEIASNRDDVDYWHPIAQENNNFVVGSNRRSIEPPFVWRQQTSQAINPEGMYNAPTIELTVDNVGDTALYRPSIDGEDGRITHSQQYVTIGSASLTSTGRMVRDSANIYNSGIAIQGTTQSAVRILSEGSNVVTFVEINKYGVGQAQPEPEAPQNVVSDAAVSGMVAFADATRAENSPIDEAPNATIQPGGIIIIRRT